jgi:TatD DNase family protein
MIDTHAHLYLDVFDEDREAVVERSRKAGIQEIWLPGIDTDSLSSMDDLSNKYPNLFRLFAGLHPCEVNRDFQRQLDGIATAIESGRYAGIGEIGLDLYWDKTYLAEQIKVLTFQLDLALRFDLPVILHVRDAFDEIMHLIRSYYGSGLRGIFHSFAGTYEQALELTDQGFLLGVNGSITFKRSSFAAFLNQLPLTSLVTETDSPYLAPVPYRGKRNEPANISLIVQFMADCFQLPAADICAQSVANAQGLFTASQKDVAG